MKTFFASNQKLNQDRKFEKSTWMPKLQQPNKAFDTSLPIYKEITTIVNIMKSGGSSCPHDHISVIILKCCPTSDIYFH